MDFLNLEKLFRLLYFGPVLLCSRILCVNTVCYGSVFLLRGFLQLWKCKLVDLVCDALALLLHKQRKAVLTSGYLFEVYEYLHKLGSD